MKAGYRSSHLLLAAALLSLQAMGAAPAPAPPMRPPPEPRAVIEVPALQGKPAANVAAVAFASGDVIADWSYLRLAGNPQAAESMISTISDATVDKDSEGAAATPQDTDQERQQGKQIVSQFTTLSDEWIVSAPASNAVAGIDIDGVIGNESGVYCLFACVLTNPEPRLVRLCAESDSTIAARTWINGKALEHGSFLKLNKGAYPILVILSPVGRDRRAGVNPQLCLSLHEVTEAEISALDEWEHDRWLATQRACETPWSEWQKDIEIDPSTLVGTEGFFRVGKSTNGHWWFIDPEGRPFFCNAVCSVNRGGLGGRRARRWPMEPEVVTEWITMMKHWGFNSLGSWTTPEFFDKNMTYVEVIETYYEGPYIRGGKYRKGIIPDVFDPAWKQALEDKCKKLCTPIKDSKLMIGYYLDNERGFRNLIGYGGFINATTPTRKETRRGAMWPLLQLLLSMNADRPAIHKAWEFVLSRHDNDIRNVGKAWGVPLTRKSDVNDISKNREIIISRGFQVDEEAFLRLWVNQYYKTAVDAVRKYDPNHLILGTRWGGSPPELVLQEEVKYTDVVSANNYKDVMYEMLDRYYRIQEKPILVGEFGDYGDYFSGIPLTMEPPGGFTEEERTRIKLRETMDRAFTHPGLVGWTWYRWRGEPPEPEQIGTYARAACRAPFIKAAWDRPPAPSSQPVHGQVFLYIDGGVVSEQPFDTSLSAAEPPKSTNRGGLRIGLTCRRGVWNERVHGNIIHGRVTEQRTEGNTIHLKLKMVKYPGNWSALRGKAEYHITLQRNDSQFRGTVTGTWNGLPVDAVALGYIYRPVPNPGL